MKTKLPILRKIPMLFALGTLVFVVFSCGSYQNSSYYDNDGVYGNYDRNNDQVTNQYSEENLQNGNIYAAKFKTMQGEYQDQYEYFTDVDNYSSETENDTVVTVYNSKYNNSNRYAGWGNNNSDVTINYYNNGWGWNSWYGPNWGWGWNSWNQPYWGWNSWYGANWGWGWNSWYGANWGWGWNSWYGPNWGWGWNSWNNPYYNGWYNGYGGRGVVYSSGPRGGRPYYGSTNRNSRGNNVDFNRPRSSSSNPRSYNNSSTNPRNNNNTSTPRPRSNYYSTPRSNNSTPRSNNYSTPRSNNYSSPRSSGGSFGGSRGGGSFGGGGRSGGGRSGGRG